MYNPCDRCNFGESEGYCDTRCEFGSLKKKHEHLKKNHEQIKISFEEILEEMNNKSA